MFQNRSIFSALYDVMREKALKQLNFAKCPSCGLFTPYRLKNVEGNAVKCKKCGSMIQLKKQIL
jgi:ribosomal protein L32